MFPQVLNGASFAVSVSVYGQIRNTNSTIIFDDIIIAGFLAGKRYNCIIIQDYPTFYRDNQPNLKTLINNSRPNMHFTCLLQLIHSQHREIKK